MRQFRLSRLLPGTLALAGIMMLGLASSARADLEIWASTSDGTNNNPPLSSDSLGVSVPSGGTTSFNGTVGTFAIDTLTTSSNSPGNGVLSFLSGATVHVQNTGASTETLYLSLGDTGFTLPTAPPAVILRSHVEGSVFVPSSANALTFQSYLNESDTQNANSGISFGPQTVNTTFIHAFLDDQPLTVGTVTAPFSLTEQFAITLGGTVGGVPNSGGEIELTTVTQLSPTSVPEPSSLVLAGIGALGMIGYGLRRRKARGA